MSPDLTGSTVLFVGLGAMGAPMARRLSAGDATLRLFDVDAGLTQRLAAETGATAVPGLEDEAAVDGVDLVVLMLPNSTVVEHVLTGPDGLLGRLRPGSTVVDMSSSRPASTVALAETAARSGVRLVDAPVSGGVARARTGELAIMVGAADAGEIDLVRPVLERMGSEITHVGPPGAGHAMKALNNLLSAVGLVAASEVLSVGTSFGLDPRVMLGVLNASTGRNHATEVKMEKFVLSGAFDSGFSLQLMVKDLRTALELAHETGTSAPVGAGALEECIAALQQLGSGADHTQVAQYVEQRSRTTLR